MDPGLHPNNAKRINDPDGERQGGQAADAGRWAFFPPSSHAARRAWECLVKSPSAQLQCIALNHKYLRRNAV